MLSILIPTYNYNISTLVTGLHRQAMESYVDFEIVVMEDGSNEYLYENSNSTALKNCNHIVLEKNIGRSAIRNLLADIAQYDHLLFMDCDAEICSPYYIEKYLSFCKEECVVIGGTAYSELNTNPEYSLRLKYGRKREARPAIIRNKNNFATFNFLISKNIFNQIRFDESIKGYGHEDTLFGHRILELGYSFIQIDNPLIHNGLDNNLIFIKKTEESCKNLFLLYKSGIYPFLSSDSKLLKSYLLIDKYKLTNLLAFKYDITRTIFQKMLCKKNPSLLLFDIYKLLYICKYASKNAMLSV